VISSEFYVQFHMRKVDKTYLLDILNSYKNLGYKYLDPIILSSIKYTQRAQTLPSELNILKKHINNCNLCSLSKTRNDFTKTSYTINDLMLVFLSPNILDNKEIYNLLKKIMNNVLDSDINNAMISYLIQCPIDKMHTDTNKYSNVCKAYLIKEIDIIKPKVIIMFGDTYNQFFDLNETILDISGSILKYDNIILIPFIDLEFIIKNPSYKPKIFTDLLKIKKLLETI